jgi:hypothetical protein
MQLDFRWREWQLCWKQCNGRAIGLKHMHCFSSAMHGRKILRDWIFLNVGSCTLCNSNCKVHWCFYLRTVCCSENPSIRDERTTTERWTTNYEANLPWELTTACLATASNTVMIFFKRYVNCSGIVCIKDKIVSYRNWN